MWGHLAAGVAFILVSSGWLILSLNQLLREFLKIIIIKENFIEIKFRDIGRYERIGCSF